MGGGTGLGAQEPGGQSQGPLAQIEWVSPNLTDQEKRAIEKLDEFHDRAVKNRDRFERGLRMHPDGTIDEFIGSRAHPEGDPLEVRIPYERDAKKFPLFGHTHEIGGEGISTKDRNIGGFELAPGQQMLIRTPTGAIRSVTRPSSPGPRIYETLRGPEHPGFPRRQ